AARATDATAVARLLAAKGRSAGQPVSIVVSSTEEIERWTQLDAPRRAFVRAELPGPVTLLLPSSAEARLLLAPGIVSESGVLGIRVPDHPVARELARRVGPITATSANRHGAHAARTPAEARSALGRQVQVYLDGEPRPRGRPSALVDLTGARPLRRDRR
ncbi:MAG: L-threonylcarbamoyladenylate synthase, partial [Thermoplasmata archaeon]|nr:L-threonylcarbamoyladenylate synthase [Thermoplasmata archaeon]